MYFIEINHLWLANYVGWGSWHLIVVPLWGRATHKKILLLSSLWWGLVPTLCPDTHSGQERRAQLPADTSLAFLFVFLYQTLSWIYTYQPYRANKHISASSAAAYATCTSHLFWNNLFHCLFRVVFQLLNPKQSMMSTRVDLLAATQLSRCLCERVCPHNVTHQRPKRTNDLQST